MTEFGVINTDVEATDSPRLPEEGSGAPGGESPAKYTFQLPKLSDPRLHVAAVLVTVQVFGQVSLGFDLSIAQILVALGTTAIIEVLLTARQSRVIAWPASALLTGNGVALILRVPGTEHGDWWSMRGWYVFAATAALALLSKYVIRAGDRPLFNPSNFGMVLTFLILGVNIADPQDLWWGPMSLGLVLTYAVILLGGLIITARLKLLAVAGTFWVVFAALMALLAFAGHAMTARWNLGPVQGMQFWTTLALSPEVLIFLFFMITDPRTAARGRTAGILYAAMVATTSAVLVAFQTTEYATKVALLSGLVLVCAARPLIEKLAPESDGGSFYSWFNTNARRYAAMGVIALAILAMMLNGSNTVPTSFDANDPQFRVELADDQQPQVEVAELNDALGVSIDQATADRVVAETLEALILADQAVEESDTAKAKAVSAGAYRTDLLERSDEPAPERTFDSAVVDIIRDADSFQAVPRLTVALEGTKGGQDWSRTFHIYPANGPARIERSEPTA